MIKMYNYDLIFSDNLKAYDGIGNWTEENLVSVDGDTVNNINDMLLINVTDTDRYIYTQLNKKIYNFVFGIDFLVNTISVNNVVFFALGDAVDLSNIANFAVYFKKTATNVITVYNEDTAAIGTISYTENQDLLKIKIKQLYFQETSTTGLIEVFYKNVTTDTSWAHVGSTKTQSMGIEYVGFGNLITAGTVNMFYKNAILQEIIPNEIENDSL